MKTHATKKPIVAFHPKFSNASISIFHGCFRKSDLSFCEAKLSAAYLVVPLDNPITESESPEDAYVAEESKPLKLEYHSLEQFSSDLLEADENYILQAIFANPVAGQVCVDYKEQIVYLEKGYVAKSIRACVLDHFKGAYDDDHAPSNTTAV